MRLGRVEILLLLLIVCGAVYMAIQYFPSGGPKVCAPVPLSPEVKAYIDQKLAANAGNAQCGDIPAVFSRVNDLETKLGGFAKFEEMRVGMAAKRDDLNAANQAARQNQVDVLAKMRNAELGRLRNEMAMMCSGISVRSSGGADNAPAGNRRGGGGGQRGRQGGGGAATNPGGGADGGGGAATNPGSGADGGAGAGEK